MKKMIIGMAMGMILVGLASASLVSFLSNVVSGEIEVSGPVFYLDKNEIMGDESWSLKLNDDDISGQDFGLNDGNNLAFEFFSESLGIEYFYPLKFDVFLDAELEVVDDSLVCENVCDDGELDLPCEISGENVSECEVVDCEEYCIDNWDEIDLESELSGSIWGEAYLVNERGRLKDFVCRGMVIGVEEKNEYSFECSDDDDVLGDMDVGDRIRFVLQDVSEAGVGTRVYLGDSRLEVVAR